MFIVAFKAAHPKPKIGGTIRNSPKKPTAVGRYFPDVEDFFGQDKPAQQRR